MNTNYTISFTAQLGHIYYVCADKTVRMEQFFFFNLPVFIIVFIESDEHEFPTPFGHCKKKTRNSTNVLTQK